MRPNTVPPHRLFGRLALALGALTMIALAAAPATEAGTRHGHRRDHARYERHRHDRPRGHAALPHRGPMRRFDVPVRLSHHRDVYRRHYDRNVWFPRHRHHHAVYLFPVWDGYRWIERPYYYCEGHLFLDGHGYRTEVDGRIRYHGRHVDVSIGF